jgi:hypothetical protein
MDGMVYYPIFFQIQIQIRVFFLYIIFFLASPWILN